MDGERSRQLRSLVARIKHFDIRHACSGGPSSEMRHQLVDGGLLTFGLHLHAAGTEIRHSPGQAERARLLSHEPPEADALHLAAHDNAASTYGAFPSHPWLPMRGTNRTGATSRLSMRSPRLL